MLAQNTAERCMLARQADVECPASSSDRLVQDDVVKRASSGSARDVIKRVSSGNTRDRSPHVAQGDADVINIPADVIGRTGNEPIPILDDEFSTDKIQPKPSVMDRWCWCCRRQRYRKLTCD